MARVAQIGIAVAAMGAVVMLMALFPGVTGLDPTPGLGIVQIFLMLIGFNLFILGALFYVKFAYYAATKITLAQQIGTRMALTGLVLAAISGLADALGFGSHGIAIGGENFLGKLQAAGILGSYFMSCMGVLIYAIGGNPASAIRRGRDEDKGGNDEGEEAD